MTIALTKYGGKIEVVVDSDVFEPAVDPADIDLGYNRSNDHIYIRIKDSIQFFEYKELPILSVTMQSVQITSHAVYKTQLALVFPNATSGSGGTGAFADLSGAPTDNPALNSALTAKAPSASPTFTGTPVAPTAAAGTNTTQVATTAHVFAERTNAATITNKTISGASNTLTNIGESSLTAATKGHLPDAVIDVAKMYGVVADGSTDNATALMLMQADLAGAGKPMYDLIFPYGEIRSSNNRFLFNIQRFRLFGNGSTFRTIYASSDFNLSLPFYVGELFQTNTLTYTGSKTRPSVHKFNSATAGATTITCTTVGDAANYAAGNRILLFGFDHTGDAYPPGMRYFELHEVVTAVAGTGVITLKRPLENTWDSAWWDVPDATLGTGISVGKPRIVLLDRVGNAGQLCRYAEFNDVVFGNNTGGNSGTGSLYFPCEKVVANRCKAEGYFWPSENLISATYDNIEVGDIVEFDKLVGNVYCNNVKFKVQTTGGSGCESITIENSQFAEAVLIGAKNLTFRNSTFRANTLPDTGTTALSTQSSRNPIRRITLEKLKFTSGPGSATADHIDIADFSTLTVGAVSGTNIIMPFTAFANHANFLPVKRMEVGVTRLFKNDGTKGGLVTGLTFDATYNSGQGAFVISGDWAAPVAAETWVWCYVKDVIDLGGHIALDGKRIWNKTSIRWRGNRNDKPPYEMHLTEKDLMFNESGTHELAVPLYGRLVSIWAKVTKIYSGSDSNAHMEIARTDGGWDLAMQINFKTLGTRYVDEFISYPASPISGDTYTTSNMGIWTKTLILYTAGSSGAISNYTAATKPDFEIIVKWAPF